MKDTIPKVQTINARQAMLAASRFSGDWKARKYHKKQIAAYGEINRAALKTLGAEIIEVKN